MAAEFLVWCDEVEPVLAAKKEPLNAHLQDSATSILANLGEAFDEQSRGDRARFFRYALRSGGECQRLLFGARRLRLLPGPTLDRADQLLRDVKMDLLRLIRANS